MSNTWRHSRPVQTGLILIGMTAQGLGMLMILMTACLVGLLSLPLWVLIILRDLKWTDWYREFKLSMKSLSRTVRESKPN